MKFVVAIADYYYERVSKATIRTKRCLVNVQHYHQQETRSPRIRFQKGSLLSFPALSLPSPADSMRVNRILEIHVKLLLLPYAGSSDKNLPKSRSTTLKYLNVKSSST